MSAYDNRHFIDSVRQQKVWIVTCEENNTIMFAMFAIFEMFELIVILFKLLNKL